MSSLIRFALAFTLSLLSKGPDGARFVVVSVGDDAVRVCAGRVPTEDEVRAYPPTLLDILFPWKIVSYEDMLTMGVRVAAGSEASASVEDAMRRRQP